MIETLIVFTAITLWVVGPKMAKAIPA